MFKVINKGEENEFVVMNGIDKKTRVYLPNGPDGRIRPYTVIDALTLGKNKDEAKTFVLLEHEELGEDDMVIAALPNNGKLWVMFQEDHKDVCNGLHCCFINATRIVVGSCYNGFDDLEDEGWKLYDEKGKDLPDVQYWAEEEINDK